MQTGRAAGGGGGGGGVGYNVNINMYISQSSHSHPIVHTAEPPSQTLPSDGFNTPTVSVSTSHCLFRPAETEKKPV